MEKWLALPHLHDKVVYAQNVWFSIKQCPIEDLLSVLPFTYAVSVRVARQISDAHPLQHWAKALCRKEGKSFGASIVTRLRSNWIRPVFK